MFDSLIPQRPNPDHYHTGRLEDQMLFDIDFERFIQYNLEFRELIVSQMLVSGYTIVDIAKFQGVSRRSITRVVKELREKFRNFLGKLAL